jgi:toxin ParE1/3/4
MKPFAALPLAEFDLEECVAYLSQDNVKAAHRFYMQVYHTLESVCEFPGIGSTLKVDLEIADGIRKFPVKGYEDYLIFYREYDTHIEVIRILHGARDIMHLLD